MMNGKSSMCTLVQRVGDRQAGGEMTSTKSMTNGPGSCLPKIDV